MTQQLQDVATAEAAAPAGPTALVDLEISLLLEGVFRHYGYDFRDYSYLSLRRRLLQFLQDEGLPTVSALQACVLHDPACLERMVFTISVTVTSFFRHPSFYRAFRHLVVPVLRTYPVLRVWLAGCATGEEVYSMAVLLEEEGLLSRARIYATDMNPDALRQAGEGRYALTALEQGASRYSSAGGRSRLSDYYQVTEKRAVFHAALRKSIVFAQHNLATDQSFNEFNVILCRNVLIYFNRNLQDRVHRLFYQSLARLGFLGLGDRETIRFSAMASRYQELDGEARIYRKVA